jgi:uncharacterized protein involved in exopolysaccharide biosynthesis/Mrp family chromosome partitioning ATPase
MGVLLAGLRRNKWLILLGILLSAGVALIALKNAQPSYDAYAEVLIETRQERVTGVEQVVSALSVDNSVVAGEIAVLRSNLLIGRVVDKLNLIEHPDFDPYRIRAPSPPARVVEIVMERVTTWRGDEANPRPELASPSDSQLSAVDARNLVIWQVKRDLKVAQSGIAYVIGIYARAADPDIAAAIANAVADQYLSDQQAIKQTATQRAIVWLDNRLVELETQLRGAEDAVVDFLAELSDREGGTEASVAQQLAELNQTFVNAQSERAAAAARLDHVRKLLEAGGHDAAAAAITSPRLQNLDQERAALERQKARLAERLGPRHPEMIALESAIDDLNRDRQAAIESALGEIEGQLVLAEGRQASLRAAIDIAHRRLIEFSRSSVRLRQLERSASAMRQVYESFLARFQETTQQLEFQKADARIITEAQPALAPSRPRKKLILVVAIAVGAVLGVAASLAREAMNRTVRSAADISRVTHLPVLGTLPRVRQRGNGAAWQAAELRRPKLSPYAEGLRLLRAALMSNRTGAKPRVILFTGTEPGVGTSSTALGFARVMTAIGKRVVLVDANLRRPAVAALLALKAEDADLVDHIEGRADLAGIIVPDLESDLAAVPTWRGRQNAADLVSSAAFRAAVEQLAATFDLVVLDAPPAVGVADAKVLAGIADAAVVVVRAGSSRESGLNTAVFALEEAGGLVVGAVLTHAALPGAGGWRIGTSPAPPVFETVG